MASTKEGYLFKQTNKIGVGKGWGKKYFILQYNLLLVFDKEPVMRNIIASN
jgi:hypothetical protein